MYTKLCGGQCKNCANMWTKLKPLLSVLVVVVLINISCVACTTDETSLSELEARVGSYVVFNCPIDFPYDYEIPYVIHWSKDGKKIFTWYDGTVVSNDLYTGRINLIDTSEEYGKASVNLTSIRESDQGLYHCQIIFPNRTPSTRNNGSWYHLAVESGSLIKIPPVNQTIMEGQTAFFHCVMKFPEASEVAWFKDGVNMKQLHELYRRSFMGPDGSLSIDPTMMSDLGEYECNVRSADGDVQIARAFLNIQYKAKVIYSPPEVYLPFGQPAILDCHFRANPPLLTLRWVKDGLLYDSHNVPGVYYRNNGSLYFSKVDESHAGSYTCTPYNALGSEGPSPVVNVIVQRPPIFTVTPRPVYIHKLGDNIEMLCDAVDRDGNHRPIITWSRKDGVPLPTGRYSMAGGNITLDSITEQDRGIYQCSATNEAATITTETELMIENIAPRAPYNLSGNSTETAITIRWQPGYIRPNLEYIVWYRLADAAEWRTMRILSKNVMEATINNLIPGREYEFMVLSQDRYGDGMFSKLFRFATKARDPDTHKEYPESLAPFTQIGPPRNLTAEKRTDGFLVSWEPPKYGMDLLRLYIVRWWQQPDHLLHGTAETTNTHYIIRQLKEDVTYRIQVFTLSITDDQVPSEYVEVAMPSPRKMRAIAIGTTVGIIFVITAISIFLYVKKSCITQFQAGNEKVGT